MARNRYPRPGHRLAPATLRELLQSPIPSRCFDPPEDTGLCLGDLDESSWQRFDEPTCASLAGEVLRAIGRAARMPMPIGDRRLPPIPDGLTLADLDLEVRTINCLVSAGIHQRPQDLRTMTIDGILGLRGFWVKCLVDLLTALEYVIDHPEARRAISHRGSATITRPRVACRYPRPGQRLAPRTLHDLLTDDLPADLVEGTPFAGRRLCDLDERVWEHLSPAEVSRLAKLIVSRVNVGCHNRGVRQRPLPRPPKRMRLEDLALENRTYNCLRSRGFDRRPEDLGKQTVGEMLSIKAFGAKCLVDLLTSLETCLLRGARLDDKLTEEAEALAATPGAAAIPFSDPRLGPLLRAVDREASTIQELIHHVRKRRLDPLDPRRLHQQLREIRRKVGELAELSLEQELISIFSPGANGRDGQIIAEYYGWDGRGGHTLEELGRKYGLSRERIRQVCVRAVKRSRPEKIFAPVLDRALAYIADRLPAPVDRLEADFDAAGFSACRLPVETVRAAAGFLARPLKFCLVPAGDGRLAVEAGAAEAPRTIIRVARRSALSYGATTIHDVAAEVASQRRRKVDPTLVEVTLETLSDFRWLDRKRGWFQLDGVPQYGLPNLIEKILAVTARIGVAKLRAAVARYRRTGRKPPPGRVLLEFCRRMPGVRVEGTTVVADPPRDWRKVLAGVEAGMVGVLTAHGPVMERGALEARCMRKGMNRFSFNAILNGSPVIAQYGHSVYGLLGASPDSKKIASLAARKPGAAPASVLRDFGQTGDGQVYLVYRLSRAAISGGVITVPAAVKKKLRGKFTLRTPDEQTAGTLVSKNGCAWGLGPVLRGRDAAPGDYLVILVDASKREALVRIGDQSILEPSAYQEQPAG